MMRTVRIRHTGSWSGVWQPGDAHPPLRVEFINGLAEVPLTTFESDQFQVYFRLEEAEGVWLVDRSEPMGDVGMPEPVVFDAADVTSEPMVPVKPKPRVRTRPVPAGKAAAAVVKKAAVAPIRPVAKLTPRKG
jgi:hypothetical protein